MAEKPTYEELEKRVQELEKIETEFKASKEALLNSEAQYRLLFEYANVGIFIAQDGYLKVANPCLSQILGYSRAELEEQPFNQFIHPEYLSLVNTRHQERLSGKTGLPQTYDFRIISKNGTIIWVQLSTILIQLKGRPATLNFLHDITYRKRAEEALREKEEKYRLLFNMGVNAMFLVENNTTQILECNNKASQVFGYSSQEMLSMKMADLSTTPEATRRASQEKVSKKERAYQTKDGRILSVDITSEHFYLANRAVHLSAVRDITKRKRAEKALRESEEKHRHLSKMLRLMCDNVPDMIWAKDLENRYIFANKALCENFLNAADTSEPIGKTDLFFAQRERVSRPNDPHWHTFGEICRDSDTITMEQDVPSHFDEYGNIKGTFLYLNVHKAPFYDEHKKMIGTVGSARDVTELKKAEEELKYSNYKFETVLNNLNFGVYVADMDSYEIVFVNEHMKEDFGVEFSGRPCWQYFHEDQTGPCEFCTNDRLVDGDGNPAEPYIWEFYNKTMNKWYEGHDQAIPWTDGRLVRMEIAIDITEKKRIKNHLEELVKERTAELEDTNTALKILLNKREKDQEEIEDKILANYQSLIEPLLNRLKKNTTYRNQSHLLDILESNFADMLSPFSRKLTAPMIQFTPKEVQVASLIKQDYSNKEIAETFNCSVRTIDAHRNNIRKKLDIKNKKVNLKTYLMTLQ